MPDAMCVNLEEASQVVSLFESAAAANLATPGRSGCIVDLPDKGRLTATGDLHDNLEAFDAIVKLARINYSPNYQVVFQEVIHGEPHNGDGDLSYRLLARIAEMKVEKPEQVHHVLSNHEMAQMTGEGIVKDGVSSVEAFDRGLAGVFGDEAKHVRAAIGGYVRSLPLAVRCANGVMCAHSLPGPYHKEEFDPAVMTRELKDADFLGPTGMAYVMVWGRGLAQTVATELGEAWGVTQFILGHQHVDAGYEPVGETMLVLNSDHAHGTALPFDLGREYTQQELVAEVVKLSSVLE